MYECPNCAANLKFDISRQQLYCEYCDTTLPPYTFHKDFDAEEREFYEITVFTCPQCGGELLTEDTTAATFCSYCGSSTILFSRISAEKRPKYIIPFTKTKEDCKSSYAKMVNKAFFAPKELKESDHIEKFRGIYMPYWVYSFRKNGESSFKGSSNKLEGNFTVTSHYDVNCQVNAEYDGISYDAASTFSDNLSAAIAPFDMKQKKPFSSAFLSGFYADRSDVDSDTYRKNAEEIVMEDIRNQLKKDSDLSKYNIEEHMKSATLENTLRPEHAGADLAMLPVWFLSYRKKDRVAYAIVNGQTGEAAADLPIDIGKFAIGSLILAFPIILLLNLLLTLTPTVLLSVCVIIASLFTIVANNMTTHILLKESCEDTRLLKAQDTEQKRQKDKFKNFIITFLVILFELPFLFAGVVLDFPGKRIVIPTVIACIFICYLGHDLKYLKKPQNAEYFNMEIYNQYWNRKILALIKPMITVIIALLIIFINPVSDIIFYSAALLCLSMICWTCWDIINCHNILTTRKLPQLNKRGGDDYV